MKAIRFMDPSIGAGHAARPEPGTRGMTGSDRYAGKERAEAGHRSDEKRASGSERVGGAERSLWAPASDAAGGRGGRSPRTNDDTFPLMDLRPTERAGTAAPHRARVRRGRDPAARRSGTRRRRFRASSLAEAGRARPDGHPVSRGVRRRGHVGGRLLHLHRRAGARRSVRRAVGRGAQRPVRRAPRRCSAARRRSAAISSPLAKGETLGAWGLTEAGAGSDAAGDADRRRGATATAG